MQGWHKYRVEQSTATQSHNITELSVPHICIKDAMLVFVDRLTKWCQPGKAVTDAQ